MKKVFQKLIVDSQEREYLLIYNRYYSIPLNSKKIVSLIGVRRSGKTYILYSLIQKLKKNVDRQNIFYINFEDDRLYPLDLKNLDELIESYYELFPDKREEKVYVFLDEVQNVDGWELFVRRIYDTLNIQIFITGSSSKLLSSEIATSLRGRTITYEIFPFSFKEYLSYRNIEVNINSSKSISYIKNALNTYLKDGGFAETFGETPDVQKRILKNYLDLIIYKDLVERYSLKNYSLLKNLIKYLFVNMGTLVSFSKLYNDYKSMGFRLGKETLFDYMSYMEDAYTLFTTPIHRNSVKEEQRNPKKIYAIDNGFNKLFDINFSADYSKLYENIVFLHLRHKTSEVYYFKRDKEVDFYVELESPRLINVSYDITSIQTKEREINSLLDGMDYYNLNNSYLINSSIEEQILINGKTITVLPLWKWLVQL